MSETTTAVRVVSGKAIPVRGNDIDTDRIIPARFMKCVTFEGLGQHAFRDERFTEDGISKGHPFDSPEYGSHPVMVVNKNFGCGSSREHAPQALQDYGIRAIVGESFAEIFAGNCTAMGIPAVSLSEDDAEELMELVEAVADTIVTVDLTAGTVSAGNRAYRISMQETYRKALLDGSWDSTSMLLAGARDIKRKAASLPYLNAFV